MIRIERNTHNFFSLLQFIAFLINTFTFSHLADAFIPKRRTRERTVKLRAIKKHGVTINTTLHKKYNKMK